MNYLDLAVDGGSSGRSGSKYNNSSNKTGFVGGIRVGVVLVELVVVVVATAASTTPIKYSLYLERRVQICRNGRGKNHTVKPAVAVTCL